MTTQPNTALDFNGSNDFHCAQSEELGLYDPDFVERIKGDKKIMTVFSIAFNEPYEGRNGMTIYSYKSPRTTAALSNFLKHHVSFCDSSDTFVPGEMQEGEQGFHGLFRVDAGFTYSTQIRGGTLIRVTQTLPVAPSIIQHATEEQSDASFFLRTINEHNGFLALETPNCHQMTNRKPQVEVERMHIHLTMISPQSTKLDTSFQPKIFMDHRCNFGPADNVVNFTPIAAKVTETMYPPEDPMEYALCAMNPLHERINVASKAVSGYVLRTQHLHWLAQDHEIAVWGKPNGVILPPVGKDDFQKEGSEILGDKICALFSLDVVGQQQLWLGREGIYAAPYREDDKDERFNLSVLSYINRVALFNNKDNKDDCVFKSDLEQFFEVTLPTITATITHVVMYNTWNFYHSDKSYCDTLAAYVLEVKRIKEEHLEPIYKFLDHTEMWKRVFDTIQEEVPDVSEVQRLLEKAKEESDKVPGLSNSSNAIQGCLQELHTNCNPCGLFSYHNAIMTAIATFCDIYTLDKTSNGRLRMQDVTNHDVLPQRGQKRKK